MRGNTKYLVAIMTACILMAFMNTASVMGEDISNDSHNGDKPGLCYKAF